MPHVCLMMTDIAANEQQIAKMARQTAKLIIKLEHEGERAAAAKLRDAAVEAADLMRVGKL